MEAAVNGRYEFSRYEFRHEASIRPLGRGVRPVPLKC